MKPDLLGYVLQTLEPDEERVIEEYLESTPEARRELVQLRPLLNALKQDDPEPSKELIFNTLRAVANERSATFTSLPSSKPPSQSPMPVSTTKPVSAKGTGNLPGLEPWSAKEYEACPTNWRRADAWALIAVVMLILLSIPPVLQYVRDHAMQVECKDNMRQLYSSFQKYMDDHQGTIPALATNGPNNRAGMYASILHDAGLWGDRLRLGCPPGSLCKPQSLEEVQKHRDDELAYWQNFAGSYAYHLGYTQNADGTLRIKSVRRGDGDGIAILADRPARIGEVANYATANSPNHGWRGQNVLHLGGHVTFQKDRCNAQRDDRDIFRNLNNQQTAGLNVLDSVLGPSEAKPLPAVIPID